MSLDSELHDSLPPPMAIPAGEIQLQLAAVNLRIARLYAWATSASFGLSAAVLAWQPSTRPGIDSSAVALAFAAVALVAALLCWGMRQPAALRVAAVGLLGSTGVGVAAVGLGWGVAAPSIGFMALHAGIVMALAGTRLGALVTGVVLLSVWALAIAQHLSLFASVGGATPLHLVVLVQTLLIVLVSGGGWVLSRAISRLLQAGEDRERRFRGLLRLSADAYWELDAGLRLVAASQERNGGQPLASGAAVGAIPWELPQFLCEPDTLDSLQADLGARQAVRDVPVSWQGRNGLRHFLLSGEPRFSSSGVFRGYWGVARDITDDLRARQALARTESRYQDLFASLPSAIVLHRDGRVIDANPAAVAMMGYPDLASMRGAQLLDRYLEGLSRSLARQRIAQLQAMTPGEALPVAEFRITSRLGREAFVRATGVAVEADGGPAVLSIYVDDTERQAAEEAVRRSEALLSHLVASSPDVITLTDFETGRFAMVNRTFERITGWTAEEVIGRTSLEVTTWHRPEDRDRFVRLVRQLGRVQDIPLQFRTRDGQAVPMLVSGARFVMDRRDYLVINSRDMTEIERSRLEMEAVLENASLGIALTRDQQFQMVNPAFEAMVGWPDGSLIGQPGACVWPSEEAYREIGRRIGPQLSRGEQVEEEVHARRRDGSTFLCRLLARAVDPSHPSRGGTIWVIEDITERKRLDEALARARDDAEAASRAKSAFLANTSHELRTPLNGLLGLAQLARVPGLEEARRTQYLEQIVESAQSLAMIVSDILDLSKIEAGRLSIATTDFDLAAMVRSLRRSYAALIADRPLTLTLELDPAVGAVRGDALRVRQILTNYLGNALKFTDAGSVRMVVRRSDGDLVRLEVHDTGPGIDAATLARLFQPFTQADESTTRRYGGTGLGLSICRELATLMGGDVGVHSALGQGSCFWVELHLPPVTLQAAAPNDSAILPFDAASTHGAHVLMVDDNEINMMVAVAQLEQFGVRVGQAVDGRQALDAVAAAEAAGDPYDLVIMDLQMPVLSGYEVTAALRQRYTAEQLPIVAHTAAALVTEREAALAAGMNDFLPKPTDTELLRRTVARWVRVAGAL